MSVAVATLLAGLSGCRYSNPQADEAQCMDETFTAARSAVDRGVDVMDDFQPSDACLRYSHRQVERIKRDMGCTVAALTQPTEAEFLAAAADCDAR